MLEFGLQFVGQQGHLPQEEVVEVLKLGLDAEEVLQHLCMRKQRLHRM